jgi:hypothetical protein
MSGGERIELVVVAKPVARGVLLTNDMLYPFRQPRRDEGRAASSSLGCSGSVAPPVRARLCEPARQRSRRANAPPE